MDPSRLDLSRIRHDLRGPINQIIGYCELLLEEDGMSDAFLADLRRIREGGRQLLEVIEEYFDENHYDARRRNLHQLNHDLRTPVNHIMGYCEMLEEQAEDAANPQLIEDLRRIRGAARTWLDLMEEHLMPVPSDGTADPLFVMMSPAVIFRTLAPRSAQVGEFAGRGRVLVVDDDPGNRELLARRLRRHGFQVGIVGSGLDALRTLRSETYDLVLLDLLMEGIDGYQVLTKLKSDPALRHIPVLMISGLDQENGIARCIEAGADDYLTKPFDPVLLRARIGACLERKHLRDQEQSIYRALLASQKALATELAEAGAYVASLLPSRLTDGPVRADWCFQPSAALGGDSFGYHWIDDDHFACYLLDVCGHGVGSALLSVSALNVLRSGGLFSGRCEDPGAVLGELNRMFPMESQNQLYFTLWLGVYSVSRRMLHYSSGGHPPAVLISPTGDRQTLRTANPPVGAIPETTFRSATSDVPLGGRLFVLSDGVYETVDASGKPGTFGQFLADLDRLIDHPGFGPVQILDAVRQRSRDDALEDDFSLLELGFPP